VGNVHNVLTPPEKGKGSPTVFSVRTLNRH
jgi:hypothetical protein